MHDEDQPSTNDLGTQSLGLKHCNVTQCCYTHFILVLQNDCIILPHIEDNGKFVCLYIFL